MDVKSVKDGIEGLPNAVLNIADVIEGGAATSPLLSNHIKVPCELKGAFGVLLANENLAGGVLEVTDELVGTSRI